jgi:hypothetical protein
MVGRESVLEQAACGSASGKKADQHQKQRNPLPTRAQREQTSQQTNSHASWKPAERNAVGVPGTNQKYSQPETGRY